MPVVLLAAAAAARNVGDTFAARVGPWTLAVLLLLSLLGAAALAAVLADSRAAIDDGLLLAPFRWRSPANQA